MMPYPPKSLLCWRPRPLLAGARQRDAVRSKVQVAKPLGIPPAAKAVRALAIRAVRVVAEFADHERAVIGAKRGARRFAQLRAAAPRPGRVGVEHGKKQGHAFLGIDSQPDRRRAERVTRPSGGQIDRRLGRPTEGAIDEDPGRFGAEEFRPDGLLTDPQPPIVEMLLVPQLDQPAGREGLDPADFVEVRSIAEGQPPPVDLVGAGEDIAPQMERLPEIEGQAEIGDALIDWPLTQPAARV